MKESLNEKVFNKVVQIFSCGSSNFENQEDEEKIIEHDSPEFGLKRRSIHFSMMLDHLTKL
jgi:hypothetical protein